MPEPPDPRQAAPAFDAPVRYYAVWVSNDVSRGRGPALCWGPPCATAGDAGRQGRGKVRAGEAVMSFVVRVEGAAREALPSYTEPKAARSAVLHWEGLWDQIDPQ